MNFSCRLSFDKRTQIAFSWWPPFFFFCNMKSRVKAFMVFYPQELPTLHSGVEFPLRIFRLCLSVDSTDYLWRGMRTPERKYSCVNRQLLANKEAQEKGGVGGKTAKLLQAFCWDTTEKVWHWRDCFTHDPMLFLPCMRDRAHPIHLFSLSVFPSWHKLLPLFPGAHKLPSSPFP